MKDFKIKIAKIDKELFSGEAVSLTVPAETGQMTMLANHAPTIAKLKEGPISVKLPDNKEKSFECKRGALEFSENQANIILF